MQYVDWLGPARSRGEGQPLDTLRPAGRLVPAQSLDTRLTSNMDGDFIVEHDFVSAADCAKLVECFERNLHLMHLSPHIDRYWNNRFIFIGSLPESEREAKRLMQDARRRVIRVLKDFYAETAELYSDTAQLVRWRPGWEMQPHADNMHADGEPHSMPWRDYSSVIYLNDKYDGGEFYFPNLGVEL